MEVTFDQAVLPTIACGAFAAARLAHIFHQTVTPNDMTNELAIPNPEWNFDQTPFEAFKLARLEFFQRQWLWGILWRDRFTRALRDFGTRDPIYHGGAALTDDQIHTLTDLLQQHGVPAPAIQDRIYHLLQKLSSEAVGQALQAHWPWTQLKQLATEKGARLVHPQELEQHIEARKQRGPAKKQPRKTRPMEQVTTLPLHLFEIPAHHFADDKKQPVPVIAPDYVRNDTSGIALMDATKPLAVLTHNVEASQIQAHHAFKTIKLALHYQPTGEKVLCTLQLLQLGTPAVIYDPPVRSATTTAVATTPIKLFWYKDQAPVDWNGIASNPVKALLTAIPALADCDKPGCQCHSWHAADAGIPLILSVYDRQWLTMDFNRTSPALAKIFAVMVRIPTQALAHVQLLTGTHGFYADPKEEDTRTPLHIYTIHWLPKRSLEDMHTLRRLHPTIIGLARMGQRYGAPTNTADAEALHQVLLPDDMYIGDRDKRSFHLYPLPWGTTKATMQKLLATWKWTAKPVATAGATPDGMVWLVVAQGHPPHDQLALKDQPILIKDVTREPKEPLMKPGTIIASPKTWLHLKQHQTPGTGRSLAKGRPMGQLPEVGSHNSRTGHHPSGPESPRNPYRQPNQTGTNTGDTYRAGSRHPHQQAGKRPATTATPDFADQAGLPEDAPGLQYLL